MDSGEQRAVAYVWTSVSRSADALKSQLWRLESRATSLGLDIVEVVQPPEGGGRLSRRASIQALLDLVWRDPTIRHVIVESERRLSRDQEEVRTVERKLETWGVHIVYAGEAPIVD